jgi:predicted nucleic acid-binding protein
VGPEAVIIADTSVLIEAWERGHRGDGAVRDRVEGLIDDGELATTAVTVMELLGGMTTDRRRALFLDALLGRLARVFPITAEAARLGAAIIHWRAGRALAVPDHPDGLIIGTCLAVGLPVLTLDRRHYEGIPGLQLAPVRLEH